MYDVIIIGAGPTGSTAAKVLAEKGHKVLLVEKFNMPRYKSCSGVLIKKSMDLVEQYFGESTPEYTMCSPADNRGMIFTDDKGKEYRFEQPGLNIWRSSFDYWLAQKAESSGAKVRDNTAAVSCEENEDGVTVTLNSGKTYAERAKYVINCEGVVGSIKRKLLDSTPPYIMTYQTFNIGNIALDPHYFYAYLQPKLSEYDAWFNVKADQLVLGVSVKDRNNVRAYYEKFIAYMKQHHNLQIDKQLKEEKWLMPQIRPGCKIDFGVGRVLFAGEIAGFLNPMGEGISAGMESGYSAACSIAEHFNDLDKIYSSYQERTEYLRNYMKRQWSLVASMAGTFSEMK